MTEKAYDKMSESEKKKEDWMNAKWRPMMGWMYMIVCICDFVIFPVFWSLIHTVMKTGMYSQWNPLTLQGAGLFHIAMGAVLGLAAWGRTQEKMSGANNGGAAVPSFGATSFTPPAASMPPAPRPSFTAPAVAATAVAAPVVMASSSGKAMPAPQEDEPL